MKLLENQEYLNDVNSVAELELPWEKFQDATLMITGASGLIGSCLIDVIMMRNQLHDMNCQVLAIGRNVDKAKARFGKYWDLPTFSFLSCDINKEVPDCGRVDYIFHLASNTHPIAYATDPIGTITTNIIGSNNLMEYASEHEAKRFIFASSNEIYGENRGDVEKFEESYCGYINSNTMRAGYPESKRCGEALCQAYLKQKELDVVIPRLTRSYGPTMLMTDTKALSQFLKKGLAKEDIVLKSAGNQYYSYTYVTDAVAGLLTVALIGVSGEAYNIADDASDIRLKDLAKIIADYAGKEVIFELPDDLEKSGYSTATKARLESAKLQGLGWRAMYDIQAGICRTLSILEELD